MGWMKVLYETYEACSSQAGIEGDHGAMLIPVSHSTAKAQVEITVDLQGKFLRAATVGGNDSVTLIPVTEDSCARSGSGALPHPLCDKLCYIAGDYGTYTKSEKDKRKFFIEYLSQLKSWTEWDRGCSEKIKAIYRYLSRESVIKDLVQEKILVLDDNNILESVKIEGTSQEEVFVRFCVVNYEKHPYEERVWKDQELIREYEAFYLTRKKENALCYITGKVIPSTSKHPAKIRNIGDKAKLISSNDTSGYTYRGRFTDAGEAVSLGYEPSQKAHSALRWLIQSQGYRNGSMAVVSWAVNGSSIPNPMKDTADLLFDSLFEDQEDSICTPKAENVNTARGFAKRFNSSIQGYRQELDADTKIVIMAVDTADGAQQGRLAVTYYGELEGSQYLKNIEKWHTDCSWKHTYKKVDDTGFTFYGAPSPKEIALSAYGTEQGGLNADDKVMKKAIERILPCIAEGRRLPSDLVFSMVRNAGRPMSLSGFNWSRILSNTCAVIKKYRKERWEEEWTMALNNETGDRNYLFGRILAVANKVEERTFEKGENRATSAKRYWNVYAKRPAHTWSIIQGNLQPYLQKLKPGERRRYENVLGEISSKFQIEDFTDEPLNELYLLGYYCQLSDLAYKEEGKDQEQRNEEEDKEELEENENGRI